MEIESKDGSFPTTHWTDVKKTCSPDFEQRLEAMNTLLRRYWQPLKSHLAAKYRLPEDRLDDLLQGFVLHRVLIQKLFAKADRARGRFRTFLLNALDNFVFNELRNDQAKKRMPQGGLVQLDEMTEAEHPSAPAAVTSRMDVVWAQAVMAEALQRLRAECEQKGRQTLWEVFDGRLLRPLLLDEPPMPYDELVAKFGFNSPAQVYNALGVAKRMFDRVLRSVIGEYVRDEHEIDEELKNWKAIFAKSNG